MKRNIKNIVDLVPCLIFLFFIPEVLFAQHETGTRIERDKSGGLTREVRESPMINVEYSGREPERPEPEHSEPGRASAGGKDSNDNNSNSNSLNSNNTSIERKSIVSINGENFSITKDTEKRLSDFIETYKANGDVGEYVAAAASIFSLFELFDLDKVIPTVEVTFKLSTFGSEEVLTKLSAPSIWNRAWRAQAVSLCESEWSLAISRGRDKDAKVWLRIRDIIANPERYKNGGIKYNHQGKKIMLRSYPAEAYRNIAGFDIALTDLDINQLGFLTNYLMFFPQSRDYIIYADYIYDLDNPKNKFKKITARDKMLLNYALLALNKDSKAYLSNAFSINLKHPNQTLSFWSTLKTFLNQDKWDTGRAHDSYMDSLGFATDEPFTNSDLVNGEYPDRNIFTTPLPTSWNVPLTERKKVYKVYRF